MTNYIEINRGECLDVEIEWKDEDGDPTETGSGSLSGC